MKELALPPSWCKSICKNSMSDACMEDCAIERKCRNLKLKPFTLEDLPDFSIDEFGKMTKEEKANLLAVYVSKITEFLKGGEDERPTRIRQNPHRNSSSGVPPAIQIKNLFPYTAKENPLHTARTERENLRKRSEGMDQK